MIIKKIISHLNPFDLSYTEKDAIRGHSVDRYNYAIQLIKENTDDSLIKSYAWLVVASEEKDRKSMATLLLHKLSFELKSRGIFHLAVEKSKRYLNLYSHQALATSRSSQTKLNYLDRFFISIVHFMVYQIDYIDLKIFQNKGSVSTWKKRAVGAWVLSIGALTLWCNYPNVLCSTLLVASMICSIISLAIAEKREDN
ncbi:MAG: hypothetical protein Q8M40_12040 [Legionella sp.]|nr:hypothetical protein [Legionella sp.]